LNTALLYSCRSAGADWDGTSPTQSVRTACGRPAGLSSPKYACVRPHQNLRARINAEPPAPEQISGWLARTYSEDREMRVSHETIYVSLFVQSRGALRRELRASAEVDLDAACSDQQSQ
jgi:hypothetical protein